MNIISSIFGTAISVPGNDIDTDRIIPARFLKCVSFNNLGPNAFEDDRKGLKERGKTHPFDDANYTGSSILFVNQNFGCGSSREHAPQSLMRWGIKAIIGESFAEIFYGNCTSLGIPCLTVDRETIKKLMEANSQNPKTEWNLSIKSESLTGDLSVQVNINQNTKEQLLTGRWNPMDELLSEKEKIQEVYNNLPYNHL